MERLHNSGIVEEVRRSPIRQTQINYHYIVIASPIGSLTLVANDTALISLTWGESSDHFDSSNILYVGHSTRADNHSVLASSEAQLREYFAGQRATFTLPLSPEGTEFQKQVWTELSNIPYGQTITYGEQARRVGRPKAARAVGAANGKNPIGIIIPCHRVIGASGALTGFAGGIEIKRRLLEIEKRSMHSLHI